MNEKNGYVMAAFIMLILMGAGIVSCKSTGYRGEDNLYRVEAGLIRQQELNAYVREQIGISIEALDDCRTESGKIRDGIDRALYLVDRYESIVQQLITALREAERRTAPEE